MVARRLLALCVCAACACVFADEGEDALLEDESRQSVCEAEAPAIVWSYPVDGATQVPTNVVMWVVGPPHEPTVTFDGKSLRTFAREARGTLRISVEELEPETSHVLEIRWTDLSVEAPEGTSATFRIAFRTGTDSALEPEDPRVYERAIVGSLSASPCQDVLRAQDCFDRGQNALLEFDVSAHEPIAWLVQGETAGESALWPVHCGAPVLAVNPDRMSQCHTVRAIGAGGRPSEPESICSDEPLEGLPDGGAVQVRKKGLGCHITSTGESSTWPLAVSLLGLAFWRRRAQR